MEITLSGLNPGTFTSLLYSKLFKDDVILSLTAWKITKVKKKKLIDLREQELEFERIENLERIASLRML